MQERSAGYLAAPAAYLLWGLLPLYWQPLNHIPAMAILSYRIAFSFVFSAGTILMIQLFVRIRRKSGSLPGQRPFGFSGLNGPRLKPTLLAAALIGVNWFTYIWSVVNGFTLEASLGYFLTPMVNLLFGIIFLKERPGPVRTVALGISVLAVAILTINYGRPPIIALTLAFSFGTYGFVKKRSGLDALTGMAFETGWLLLPALGIMLFGGAGGYLFRGPVLQRSMLILAGPVTLAPLLLFASAAKRIPLYALGFFQYIAPSLMFLLGWLVFGEEVSSIRLLAFSLVWVALVIFSASVILQRRKVPAAVAQ
jgi:chloramphenicol-sensitive protein RarD